jgi:hypothetical protein
MDLVTESGITLADYDWDTLSRRDLVRFDNNGFTSDPGYENDDDLNLYAYVYNDPLDRTDPTGNAPPGCGGGDKAACPPTQTKVELVYNAIGKLPNGDVYHHTYVRVTSADGKQAIFRGGPSAGGSSGGTPGASSNSTGTSSGSGGTGASGSVGGFGTLKADTGAMAAAIDAGSPVAAAQTVVVTSKSFTEVNRKLEHFAGDVNKAGISYGPVSTNSNAFAHQAVTTLGIPRPPPIVLAPGSEEELNVDK